MNNVSLIGRLVKDPELRYLPNGGQAVARFTLAVDRNYSKQQRQEAEAAGRQTADFIFITAWGKSAEFCANYIEKGNRVAIQGRITTGSYEGKDGKRVYTTEVTANSIEPIDWKNTSGNSNSNYDQSNFGRESDFGSQNDFGTDSDFNEDIDDDDIPF
ncbi:MAG: single-stranded DNA-binding protein [Andreesenia angusta]|nr:single-stranded DNA-binding protein [Andreesenia angusta]